MGEIDIKFKGQRGLAALTYFLMELEETIPYYSGKTYKGHTVSHKGDSWLLVLRGEQNHVAYVAFFGGNSPESCYRSLYSFVYYNVGHWRIDKYRGGG